MASVQHAAQGQAPTHGDDWLLRGTQQRLDAMARERDAHATCIAVSKKALTWARAVLARSYEHPGGAAVTPRPVARRPPRDNGAEPVVADLGREVAAATLDAVRHLADTGGIAFEVANPEPLLRGVAGAYAAIARTLPGGMDEAWALLGLLALELEEDGAARPSSPEPDTSGPPWPQRHEPRTGDGGKAAVAPESGTDSPDQGSALLATADRHIAETEAHLVHQAVLIGQMAARGRSTSLADTLLWLSGQTLDALHEHRRALLEEEGARARATAAGPGSPAS